MLVIAAFAVQASSATAACSGPELAAFERAVRDELLCRSRALRTADPAPCTPRPAPQCAAAELAEVLELLGGEVEHQDDARLQARCQVATYRAAHRFLRHRLRERLRGERRQRRSAAGMRLERRCQVEVVGPPGSHLPRLGGACGDAAPGEGSVDPAALRRCLRPQLERIANSLLGAGPVRPNLLLIVTDDQHPAALSSLDGIAERIFERGLSFANAFTTTPVCAPSRAGILTGMHAPRHGVSANIIADDNGQPSDGALAFDDSATIASRLAAAGYVTALHGKYMNSYRFLSPYVPPGWDDWRVFVGDNGNFFDYSLNENGSEVDYGASEADYSTDVIAAHSLRFVEEQAENPFFLVFAPFAPHEPSIPAPRHEGALSGLPPWRPPSWGDVELAGKPNWFRFFATPADRLADNDPAVIQQLESLLAVEERTLELLDRLEELGLTDNTVVVFTADHGLLWGEHRWTTKLVAYEESIRIPLALRYPLGWGRHTSERIALNLDIAPTLASLARLDDVPDLDGRDLTEILDDPADWRSEFVIQHFEGGFTVPPWDCLRTESLKLVRHRDADDELYNLDDDPYEQHNLANDPAWADPLADLRERLR